MIRLLQENDLFTPNTNTEHIRLRRGFLYTVIDAGHRTGPSGWDVPLKSSGHKVTAVRLNAKTHKPMGAKIEFHQTGNFFTMVFPSELNLLGTASPAHTPNTKYTVKFKP